MKRLRLAASQRAQPGIGGRHGQRRGQMEALAVSAAQGAQLRHLPGRLDALGHHHFVQRATELVPVLECLCNLGAISRPRFFLSALPLAVKGLDACPVRALALED